MTDESLQYMVKNPGLLPRMKTVRRGDLRKNRTTIREILDGCWASRISPAEDGEPFVANATIANPPSFAHIHCAQALGIPLYRVHNAVDVNSCIPSSSCQHQQQKYRPETGKLYILRHGQMPTWNGCVTSSSTKTSSLPLGQTWGYRAEMAKLARP